MESALLPILSTVADGRHLSQDEAARAFQIIMNGGATPAQMGALMMGLRVKGETAAEIAGAVNAVRAKAQRFPAPKGAIDTCGTGGDGKGSLNVSTAVAAVLAGCGVPTVKHGGRAVSSRAGSADVLEALGVKIEAESACMERALDKGNLAFLYAPKYHPAMRHVAPVRQELKIRSIFNLIGPLSNPAAPTYQLLGVYAPSLLETMAGALAALGTARAWVVHGAAGEDELSLAGESQVVALENGALRRFTVSPEEAGLPLAAPEALAGGTAEENAIRLSALLAGEKGPYRNAVLLNAAAGLVVAERAASVGDGVVMAAAALDEGKAFDALQALVRASQAAASATI